VRGARHGKHGGYGFRRRCRHLFGCMVHLCDLGDRGKKIEESAAISPSLDAGLEG